MQPSIGAKIAANSDTTLISVIHKGDEIIAAETTAPILSGVDSNAIPTVERSD
jgi:hypothetical protein